MSILRSLEGMIANVVEGSFSRVFRSEVRPIEIARRLAREMEDHRSQSLAHVYVPNEYEVFLSSDDRRRFREYENVLSTELSSYLLEHARREGFTLTAPPEISFETDPRLGLGQFGIRAQTSHLQAPARRADQAAASSTADAPGRTVFADVAERPVEASEARPLAAPRPARLSWDGNRVNVGRDGVTIGRSRRCEIVIDDANVSRRHAQVTREGNDWVLKDLESTNGTRLNGSPVQRPELLRAGDKIGVGAAIIEFSFD